jgi:hypothetical protein
MMASISLALARSSRERQHGNTSGGSFSITKRKTIFEDASTAGLLSPTTGLMPTKKQKRKVPLYVFSFFSFEILFLNNIIFVFSSSG